MNVILVDWSVGASGPGYEDSVPNTRVAGAMIARLVQDLSTVGGQSLKVRPLTELINTLCVLKI